MPSDGDTARSRPVRPRVRRRASCHRPPGRTETESGNIMLDQAQIDQFHREGFLIARNVVPLDVIDALQEEINAVIDRQARMLRERGEITELREDAGFLHRAALLYGQSPRILDPLAHGTHTGPAIFNLLTCPAILDIMEQLLGPEILVSSIYRLRPKLPGLEEGVIPWHQDSAYFHSCADDVLVPTFWVPMMNATVETGCMEVLPGCHRKGVFRHYWADLKAPGLSVHPDHMPDVDPVPVPADIGDAVMLTNLTPHRSTDNVSGVIRWTADPSLQFAGGRRVWTGRSRFPWKKQSPAGRRHYGLAGIRSGPQEPRARFQNRPDLASARQGVVSASGKAVGFGPIADSAANSPFPLACVVWVSQGAGETGPGSMAVLGAGIGISV